MPQFYSSSVWVFQQLFVESSQLPNIRSWELAFPQRLGLNLMTDSMAHIMKWRTIIFKTDSHFISFPFPPVAVCLPIPPLRRQMNSFTFFTYQNPDKTFTDLNLSQFLFPRTAISAHVALFSLSTNVEHTQHIADGKIWWLSETHFPPQQHTSRHSTAAMAAGRAGRWCQGHSWWS